ncbi:hypothetical protein B4U80_02274 [Leptotrombidium deliense]|uniref:SDE2-like domain-containing protein n=1 Tax=Leptotrombidium deliense TaxID=299467 RepID=A0A443SKR4_9ACAR|nr:hypothetical protein B4U80_02274 [Leptotrombidium deliense]
MKNSTSKCIIYKSLVDGRTKTIDFVGNLTADQVYQEISVREGISAKVFRILENGKPLKSDSVISDELSFLSLFIPMCGGKGGFGSMLRAIGAQIEKTTNKEACRDLSGRRLRDINAEKRIKEWIKKQAERKEEEVKKKKEKLEKMRQEPKIEFKDEEYFKSREEIPENVESAIEYGLKMEASTSKLPEKEIKKKQVKNSGHLWIGVDIDDDDDDEDDDDEETNKLPSTDKHDSTNKFDINEPSTSKRCYEESDSEVCRKKQCVVESC